MMQHRRVTPGVAPRLLLVYLVLACVVGSTHGAIGYAPDLFGPCEPSFVQQRSMPRVTPVAYRVVDTTPEAPPGAVRLEWLGHSSFLLTSPLGVRMWRHNFQCSLAICYTGTPMFSQPLDDGLKIVPAYRL